MYKKILFFVLTISSCFETIAAEQDQLQDLLCTLPADINTKILTQCLYDSDQSEIEKLYPLVRSLLCYHRSLMQQDDHIEQKRRGAATQLAKLSALECLQLRDKYKDERDKDECAAYAASVSTKLQLFSYCAQHSTILKNPLFKQSIDWTQRYTGEGCNCERRPLFWDLLSAIDEGQRNSAAPQVPVSLAEDLLKMYGIDLVTLRWSASGMWEGGSTVDHAIDLRNKPLLALLIAHEGLPSCNLHGNWLTNNRDLSDFDYTYLEPLLKKRIDIKHVQQAGRDLISGPVLPAYDYEQMIRFLIKYGFRVNDRVGYFNGQQQHRPLLHVAMLHRNVDACKALIACGADVTARDSEGNMPFAIACELNDPSCIELLKSYNPGHHPENEVATASPFKLLVRRSMHAVKQWRDKTLNYLLFGSEEDEA